MDDGVAIFEIARHHEVLARWPGPAADWLSATEQRRLDTLRIEARRRHYLAGHALVRELLGHAFGKTPAYWSLQERKSQAPRVADSDDRLRVAISHSGDWVAAAIAMEAIGIDIEQRPRPLDVGVQSLLLTPDEAPGSVPDDVLLQRWVVKEAWIKRNGESALPARLRQLQVVTVAHDYADVRLHVHDAFHFALAIAPGVTALRRGTSGANLVTAYCVVDAG